MKRFIPLAIALAFWFAVPPARVQATGGASKIITSYAGTPSAPFSSSDFDLTNVGEARVKIKSASTSSCTVIIQHKADANDEWSTGFTCTDPTSAGECATEGLGYVSLAKTKHMRVTVSAYASGSITVWLETTTK